jgi:anti-sigma-K factor RskA
MDNHIEELLAFYALGTLTDEEREQVEAYLADHPEAQAQIEELEYSASALPYGIAPVRPSDQPKRKLMARIAADQRTRTTNHEAIPRPGSTSPRNRFGGFPQLAFSALSLAIAAVAITAMFFLNAQVSRLQGEVTALRDALLAQADTVRELNIALEQVNARLPQSPAPGLTTFNIGGTAIQPDARAQLLTDPDSHSAVLVVSGLEPLPAGKTYQIWLIEGDSPKSAGLMNVDAHGQGVSVLSLEETVASFDALGVSIEPESGSLLPTGDIVLLGEFQ